jgi:3-phenylpropionate/cinnamic acid dioxygenase small subunit
VTPAALADRDAVAELLHRYARGVDAQDVDAVAACFTPDAAYEGTLGRGTVADALRALAGAFPRYDATMHAMHNGRVVLHGDTARSTTDCVARHRLRAGGWLVVGVTYHDGLVRTSAGWRIAARRVEPRWTRREPA